jgi:hypothetical protein
LAFISATTDNKIQKKLSASVSHSAAGVSLCAKTFFYNFWGFVKMTVWAGVFL